MKSILLFLISSISFLQCQQRTNSDSKDRSELISDSSNTAIKTDSGIVNEPNTYVQDRKKDSEYFSLISAASEDWVAGVKNGGRGTEYYFKMIVNTEPITFDSVWIDKKVFTVFISKNTKAVSSQPIKFTIGDTITVRVSDIQSENKKEKPDVIPPKKYDGAALIGFIVNGERNYFVVMEIEKRKTQNRP